MDSFDTVISLQLIGVCSKKISNNFWFPYHFSLPAQAVGVAKNIIDSYREKFDDNGSHFPIVLSCLTGSERSGIVAVAICTILATQLHRPMLIGKFGRMAFLAEI